QAGHMHAAQASIEIEPQVLHKRWQYDPVGEVVNKTHNRYGETRYGYDPTGRIEHAFGAGLPAQMFRWDEAANLVSGSHPGGYVEHNRLKMFEDKRFEYDVYGRLTRKLTGRGPYKEQKFEYDAAHRLTKVTTLERNTIATIRFEYDALGRRIRKTNGYVGTDFLWDGMRLLQESRGDDEATYLYEPDSYVPLARIDSQAVQAANDDAIDTTKTEGIYYFHNDVSGLPEELTDVEGHVVWQAQYRVWGSTVREEWTVAESEQATVVWTSPGTVRVVPAPQRRTPLPQNLRFQGQYLDRETGLHYNTFRFYDPDIGRFISHDPIGLAGGDNLYQYAPNPLQWIDPLGLWGSGPRTKYRYNGDGSLKSATARIRPEDLGTGTPTNASSRLFARALGLNGDDAGHAIGNRLGGSGGKGNVFPQAVSINRGEFRDFEGNIAEAVKSGSNVIVRVAPLYDEGSTRPHSILYQARVDGQTESRIFSNPRPCKR
ncbi:RHS repeat-associated core domain-containing protein, partial [Trinickia sp. LjRoot230]|uniref:RHS repeat-associated core domain-containing protein n=1 Tax=Trinickia sp. LjRoot230 TaxID=3342288 RepID=UPI003F50CA9C